MISVANALGAGSGIDTQRLVADLAAAQRAPRDAAVRQRTERNQARISALGQLRAGLDAFSNALTSLARSGALGPQPRSSDVTIATATRSTASSSASFSQTIEVEQLARGQALSSRRFASANEPVGLGAITIELGTATTSGDAITGFSADLSRTARTVTIDPAKDSLAGLRDAINAAAAGVTASIVNDGGGVRLQVRGETGAANGFRITAAPTSGSAAGLALSDFAFTPGASTMALSTPAQNARLSLDGLSVERAGNILNDLVPGYSVELRRAAAGTPVTLSADRDPAGMRDLADSFVGAYNEVQAQIAAASRGRSGDAEAGPLFGQSIVRTLADSLAQLTSRPLATGGTTVSLAEIGIKTERSGQLALDAAVFERAVAADPTIMEKLFAPSQAVNTGGVTITSTVGAAKAGLYQVTGAAPATAGRFIGVSMPTAFDYPVAIDSTNASFTIELDGAAPVSLALPVGSYTSGAALAAAFEQTVNSNPAIVPVGPRVRVGWDVGTFRFLSLAMGSRSAIGITGMDATLGARLGIDSATATAGTNASGSIAGIAAVGNGTRLIASASSAAAGLSLDLGATAPTSFAVSVGEGLSGAVARIKDQLSKGDNGLGAAQARYDREARQLSTLSTTIETQSQAYSGRLSRQFIAMERAVAAYKSTGDFLSQQVDLWSNQNRR